MTPALSPRRLRLLFFALAVLYLLPLWVVRHVRRLRLGAPPGDPLAKRLLRCYNLVSENDAGELYEWRKLAGCRDDEKEGSGG